MSMYGRASGLRSTGTRCEQVDSIFPGSRVLQVAADGSIAHQSPISATMRSLWGAVVSKGCTQLYAPKIDSKHPFKRELVLDHLHRLSVCVVFFPSLVSQKINSFNSVKYVKTFVWCNSVCGYFTHLIVNLFSFKLWLRKTTIKVTFEHLEEPNLPLQKISSSSCSAADDYDRKTQCYIRFFTVCKLWPFNCKGVSTQGKANLSSRITSGRLELLKLWYHSAILWSHGTLRLCPACFQTWYLSVK